MQTFEEYYNEKLIEEGLVDTVKAIPEKMAQLKASLGEISTTAKGIPETLKEMGDWTVNAGLAGIGGAFAAQGLGTLLQIIAKKMDRERAELARRKEGERDIMVNTEFTKAIQKGEALTPQQSMKLLEDISNKWAKQYKIPKPQLFVAAMNKTGKILTSKLGTLLGAVLVFLAFKMAIPFPSF